MKIGFFILFIFVLVAWAIGDVLDVAWKIFKGGKK